MDNLINLKDHKTLKYSYAFANEKLSSEQIETLFSDPNWLYNDPIEAEQELKNDRTDMGSWFRKQEKVHGAAKVIEVTIIKEKAKGIRFIENLALDSDEEE